MPCLGPTQIAILRTVGDDQWFVTNTRTQQVSAMKLHDRGLLDRDPKKVNRFRGNAKGFAVIVEHDGDIERCLGEQ